MPLRRRAAAAPHPPWQGRQTALASLAGLGAILFSLVAVNFVVGDFHGFCEAMSPRAMR